jgi:signal transduction histidine kinase/ActR/RegA family two-component response regulator
MTPEIQDSTALNAAVENRFGVLPNFFCLGGDTVEITTNLWGFAQFGYLDNPLPSIFKERLFVYLSRFCNVRYCITRHVGFLVGLGRPAGDRWSLPETVEQVVLLLRRPLPRGDALEPHLTLLRTGFAPLVYPQASGSAVEEAVFACAAHVFLQTPHAARCLDALRRLYTDALFQHLMVLLTFVRTAHYWTKVHPELGLEDDVKHLFATHEALAECVRNDPEASACEMSEMILDELPSLRRERGRREAMERLLEEQRADADLKISELQIETDAQLRDLLAIAENAREAAETANRTKDEFLAMISHELRAPMHAMFGWIRILKTAGSRDADLVGRAVETLERNVKIQAQTVNDLLDVSRILSGKLQLDKAQVELSGLVAGCVQSHRPSAEGKQIALRLIADADDLNVLGDEARLQQVVANLLGNAIKFTDAGGSITVKVRRQDAFASLVVEDTGQGIPPHFLPHLFNRFSQADRGSTRAHGGLGLGLSIVKNVVSLHGGQIHAESAGIACGARFSVVIPLASVAQRMTYPASLRPPLEDGTLRKLDVLLVEDDADSRDALALVLQSHGSRVRSTGSVREALAAYDLQPPDVVISDVGMPGENGYVLIRAIRDREEGRSHRTLAIAITGFAGRHDQETALRAGFDEHVAKPVAPDDLLERVRVLAASRTVSGNEA